MAVFISVTLRIAVVSTNSSMKSTKKGSVKGGGASVKSPVLVNPAVRMDTVETPPKPESKAPFASRVARHKLAEVESARLGVEMTAQGAPRTYSPASKSAETTGPSPAQNIPRVPRVDEEIAIFTGRNPLQFAMLAHYMAYGSALLGIILAVFAIAYLSARSYNCSINGTSIDSAYIADDFGTCRTTYVNDDGKTEFVCCSDDQTPSVDGSAPVGALLFVWSVITIILNDSDMGCSLWFPNDTLLYSLRVSPLGFVHFVVGVVSLVSYVTALAGTCFITTGITLMFACYREECGDGGYFERKRQKVLEAEKKRAATDDDGEDRGVIARGEAAAAAASSAAASGVRFCWRMVCSPYDLVASLCDAISRAYNEDTLGKYVWLGVYGLANFILFVWTLDFWYAGIDETVSGLQDGTLDVSCESKICRLNRAAVRYGPISGLAPWAKAAGNCLNLNCSLVLLPVTKVLLNRINNWGVSFSRSVKNTDYMAKFFAHPISRYIPLQKNIEFHKLVALAIFVFVGVHVLFHLLNLQYASRGTMARFKLWGWVGTSLLTGAIVTYAFFIICSGAPNRVRWAKFEVFFVSHQFFIVFFLVMFLHGPVFIFWSMVPVALYLIEKYLETSRGKDRFEVTKVEWIPPVLALYFRPVHKVGCDVHTHGVISLQGWRLNGRMHVTWVTRHVSEY